MKIAFYDATVLFVLWLLFHQIYVETGGATSVVLGVISAVTYSNYKDCRILSPIVMSLRKAAELAQSLFIKIGGGDGDT